MPKLTQVNFDVSPDLKKKFDVAVKRAGFATMAEAYRHFMRETVAKHGDNSGSNQPAMAG